MKEQYVGDVSDYRKYALLRALAQHGRINIGVCWMLTPPDDRPDGRKIGYLSAPTKWRGFDPCLFDQLSRVVDDPGMRRLALIEDSGIVPGATYYDPRVPDELTARRAYMVAALDGLRPADLIFFDPDNGVETKGTPKGRKNSSKYVYRDELEAAYQAGHSLLIYQHFVREERLSFIRRLGLELRGLARDSEVWSIETAHVAFLLVVQPRHQSQLSVDGLISGALRHGRMFRSVRPFADGDGRYVP